MCSRHLFDLNYRCFQMTDNASSLARLCQKKKLLGLVLLLPSLTANKVWLLITSKLFWLQPKSRLRRVGTALLHFPSVPDDQRIFLFSSTQTFRLDKKVDELFPKLAELSSLLASGELAHSPAGWVTLNTLNAYTAAVPGNFDSRTQTVVDAGPSDDQLLQLLAIDDKTGRRRFQVGSHSVGMEIWHCIL